MKILLYVLAAGITYFILDGVSSYLFISFLGEGALWMWIAISAIIGIWRIKKESQKGLPPLFLENGFNKEGIFKWLKIMASGILLVMPGLVTDVIGLILLFKNKKSPPSKPRTIIQEKTTSKFMHPPK